MVKLRGKESGDESCHHIQKDVQWGLFRYAKNPHNAFKRHISDTLKASDSLLTYCTVTFKLLSYSLNNI